MMVSVVIPAYNEEKTIEKMLNTYRAYLQETYGEFELILVDDGSRDKTFELARACKDVICISCKKNRGKGYAVKRGFLRATGDYIFFTDADLSYSPQYIGQGVDILAASEAEGVVGVRTNKKKDYTFFRRVLSDIFALVVRRVISTSLKDTQCGFKGFKKATGKQIFSQSSVFDFGFDFEVIYLSRILGKTLCPMSVSFEHRKDTKVHIVRDGFCAMRDLIYIKRRGTDGIVKKTI